MADVGSGRRCPVLAARSPLQRDGWPGAGDCACRRTTERLTDPAGVITSPSRQQLDDVLVREWAFPADAATARQVETLDSGPTARL
jgi:hypothetical protein